MAGGRRGIAVIGLGMAVTPHAKSLVDLTDRVEVRAAVSRSEARRKAFAERFPFPTTGDLDAVLSDPRVEAVLLLTPPNARVEIVERLAAAGKHVLMEKPVERTTAGALEIAEACRRAGITAGVVFQHRFREGSERLRRLLAEGALGEVAVVQLTVPWWRPQSYYDEPGRGTLARVGGGVLISQAIHPLDLMLSLAGPVAEVASVAGTSRMHRMETEDFVAAGLRFLSGAMGGLIATTACHPGMAEKLVLTGTKGTATLEAGTLTLAWLDGREERHGEVAGTGGGADPMAFPHDWHKGVLTDFLDALDQGRPPRVSLGEALRVHHLIDALLASSSERRTVAVREA
ncbi:MAG TPA: Gfo/Idh/MocA family oxidoreductase [Geminicoccaceae bacterium]|nr:Gfo/Idh/MocA family oxidoreductase [Geminicoccaceae bacterium]